MAALAGANPTVRSEVQGLLASGFGRQKAGDFLLLGIDDADSARGWLATLLPRLTMSDEPSTTVKYCLAFSAAGLSALGLPDETLQDFAKEFREGMVTPHRQRILGDLPSSPSDPEIWAWGGPRTTPVHAMLLIYAPDRATCNAIVADERAALRGVVVLDRLSTASLGGKEHFGFQDGLTNPFSPELHGSGLLEDALPLGELVMGYPGVAGDTLSTATLPRESAPQLPACPTDDRRADFGHNGTYLVFRQLMQDVRAFWQGIADSVQGAGLDQSEVVAMAAKQIGRWPDGTPLSALGDGLSSRGHPSLTFADDLVGLRCPVGAHVRRANPRDGLLEDPNQSRSVVRAHRLLRRGRPYGAPAPAEWYPDGVRVEADDELPPGADTGRGLYFMGICTDIGRQFEFVQQTWLNNPKFGGLLDEADPMFSDGRRKGYFTVPRNPVRVRLPHFSLATNTVGGAYLLLPSRSALKYLAGVP